MEKSHNSQPDAGYNGSDWQDHMPSLQGTELTSLTTKLTNLRDRANDPGFILSESHVLNDVFFGGSTSARTSTRNIELLEMIMKGPEQLDSLEASIRTQKQKLMRDSVISGVIPYIKETYSEARMKELFMAIDCGEQSQLDLWTINSWDKQFDTTLDDYADQYETQKTYPIEEPTLDDKTKAIEAFKITKAILPTTGNITIYTVLYQASTALQGTAPTDAIELTAYNLQIAGAAIIAAANKEKNRATSTPNTIRNIAKEIWQAAKSTNGVDNLVLNQLLGASGDAPSTVLDDIISAIKNNIGASAIGASDAQISNATKALSAITLGAPSTAADSGNTARATLLSATSAKNNNIATSAGLKAAYAATDQMELINEAFNELVRNNDVATIQSEARNIAKRYGATDSCLTRAVNFVNAAIDINVIDANNPLAAYAALLAAKIESNTPVLMDSESDNKIALARDLTSIKNTTKRILTTFVSDKAVRSSLGADPNDLITGTMLAAASTRIATELPAYETAKTHNKEFTRTFKRLYAERNLIQSSGNPLSGTFNIEGTTPYTALSYQAPSTTPDTLLQLSEMEFLVPVYLELKHRVGTPSYLSKAQPRPTTPFADPMIDELKYFAGLIKLGLKKSDFTVETIRSLLNFLDAPADQALINNRKDLITSMVTNGISLTAAVANAAAT